jgi:hypothetical protein
VSERDERRIEKLLEAQLIATERVIYLLRRLIVDLKPGTLYPATTAIGVKIAADPVAAPRMVSSTPGRIR